MNRYDRIHKVGICDDNKKDLQQLKELFEEISRGKPLKYEICLYTNGNRLYESCLANQFDLVFLDIEMPGMGGFELIERLKKLSTNTYYVFVSNHENLVFKSFDYSPWTFIRKSCLKDDLQRLLNRYLQAVEDELTYIITDSNGRYEIPYKQIIYFSCFDHDVAVHTLKGKYLTRGSLSLVEKQMKILLVRDFIRIYKNFLVNMKYMLDIAGYEATLENGDKLPISKVQKKRITDTYRDYMCQRE